MTAQCSSSRSWSCPGRPWSGKASGSPTYFRQRRSESTSSINELERKTTVFYALIILAAVMRILPHPLNFTPIAALGLFAGAYAGGRLAWAVPLAALLIGDVFTGFYNPVVMACVYVGFAL